MRDTQEQRHRAPFLRRRSTVVVAGISWSVASIGALVGLVMRSRGLNPSWATWLILHSGNVAVGGFILAACYPGAWLERRENEALKRVGAYLLEVAAFLWGAFFVAMEFLPLFETNYRDIADIPFALIGVVCGYIMGKEFQQHLINRW